MDDIDFDAYLKSLTTTRLRADAIRGSMPPPFPTPMQLQMKHRGYHTGIEQMQQDSARGKFTVRSSAITNIYPPSQDPLQDLKEIHLRDLRLETQHRGCVLRLKTITPATPSTAAQVATKDANGDAVTVALYNCWDRAQDLKFYLPENSELVIKEPYCKMGSGDGQVTIRVDHPSDVIIIRNLRTIAKGLKKEFTEENLKDAGFLKEWGNDMFQKGNYLLAVYLYTKGLTSMGAEAAPELADTLLLNRAQAYLKLGNYFEPAIKDAAAVVARDDGNTKAHWRLAMGYYQSRQFDLCRKHARKALAAAEAAKTPKRDIEVLLERVNRRLKEQATGAYDFAAMRKMVIDDGLRDLDFADFLSSSVEMRVVDGMGTGVFAKKDIKCGELVLCEKGFAVAFEETRKDKIFLMNVITKEMRTDTSAQLDEMLVARVSRNPELAKTFFASWAGDYSRTSLDKTHKPLTVDRQPVIDSFLVDRIRSLNAFGCGPSSEQSAFLHVKHPDWITKRQHLSKPNSSGFWLRASRINHACIPNVYRAFVGDMMLVRAGRDLKAGEQLFTHYAKSDEAFSERREKLRKHWGFVCQCGLCSAQGKMGGTMLAKQEQLARSIKTALQRAQSAQHRLPSPEAVQTVDSVRAAIEKDTRALEGTYAGWPAASVVQRTQLADAHMARSSLSAIHTRAHQVNVIEETIECCGKALTALGFVLEDGWKGVKGWSGYKVPLAVEGAVQLTLSWGMKGMLAESMRKNAREVERCRAVSKVWEGVARKLFTIVAGMGEGFDYWFED